MVGTKPKKLRMRHILLLHETGLRHNEFLFLREDAESSTFYHLKTQREVCIRR